MLSGKITPFDLIHPAPVERGSKLAIATGHDRAPAALFYQVHQDYGDHRIRASPWSRQSGVKLGNVPVMDLDD